jgi:hypothetical protein
VTVGVWQAFHIWAPFIIALISSFWVFWCVYVAAWLESKEELSDGEKNQIAFHAQFTSNIGRLQNSVENYAMVSQNQTKRIDELEKANKRLLTIVESMISGDKD